MKSRHLTKKYKHKSRSRSRRRKTRRRVKTRKSSKNRRRVLKGGAFEYEKQNFIRDFFNNIRDRTFPAALCALHTFYKRTIKITQDDIEDFLRSNDFKTAYENMFYTYEKIRNIGGGCQTNIEPTETLMFFQSYIFIKLLEGKDIDFGNGIVLHFTPGPDSFLKILKHFLCYLDTACLLTISYEASQEIFNKISDSQRTGVRPSGVTKGQFALYYLYTNLEYLGSFTKGRTRQGQMIPEFPGIVNLLEQMTRGDGDHRIYSFNPQNLCNLIRMILHDSE
jgi:hypothetical protein